MRLDQPRRSLTSARVILAAPIATALSLLCVLPLATNASPPISDVIKRVEPHEYLVKIELHIQAYQHHIEVKHQYSMNLENTPVVWPIIPDGGFHELDMDRLGTKLFLEDREARSDFKMINANSLETQLGRFVIKEFKGKQVDIRVEEFITCYDAIVDEKAAMVIGWPDKWNPEVQSALQAQAYIESTNETIVRVVEKVLGKNYKKKVTPYLTAKVLARTTTEIFRTNGKMLSNDRLGMIDGLLVKGADNALQTRRGSWFDGICLYVAMLRAAGIPARPVIGLDNDDDNKMTAWVEFYLPTAGWVSVDLREMYASPGIMKTLDRKWKGFGTNEDLNELIPIAHHFHPPAGVMGGGIKGRPLMWGWLPHPEHTPNHQRLRFQVMDAPKGGHYKKKTQPQPPSKKRSKNRDK